MIVLVYFLDNEFYSLIFFPHNGVFSDCRLLTILPTINIESILSIFQICNHKYKKSNFMRYNKFPNYN